MTAYGFVVQNESFAQHFIERPPAAANILTLIHCGIPAAIKRWHSQPTCMPAACA